MPTHGMERTQPLRAADDGHVYSAKRRNEKIARIAQLADVPQVLPVTSEDCVTLDARRQSVSVERGWEAEH
jgi:hypothetical protein